MIAIDRIFKRLSPAELGEQVTLPAGWFVISFRHVPGKDVRRKLYGKWCKISSESGSIFRVLRFTGNLAFALENPAEIILDYSGWLELTGHDEDTKKEIELKIRRAKWYQYPSCAHSHPDPSYKLANWIALLSLGLGLLSIALAIWAFFR